MDEGFDTGNRTRLIELLRQASVAGAIVIAATHDDGLMDAADQTLRLHGGRLA